MLVKNIGSNHRNSRKDFYSSEGLNMPSDKIMPVYVLVDNSTQERFLSVGYCPDVSNREDQIFLPKQITIYCYDFIPSGYQGGFNPVESISNAPREELVEWLENLWLKDTTFDKDDINYLSEVVLNSSSPEVSKLRKKIAHCERFYMSSDLVADFTYNYSTILSNGGSINALEIFSDVYFELSKCDIDAYEFIEGFNEMVSSGAIDKELKIYSIAALKLLFKGEPLNDPEDYYGGLNNRCISYVRHEKRKGLQRLSRLCLEAIKNTDERHKARERAETLNEDLREVLNKNPYAYEWS